MEQSCLIIKYFQNESHRSFQLTLITRRSDVFLINCSLVEGMKRSLRDVYVQLARPWRLQSLPKVLSQTTLRGQDAREKTSLTAEATLRQPGEHEPEGRHHYFSRGSQKAMSCSFVRLPGVCASSRGSASQRCLGGHLSAQRHLRRISVLIRKHGLCTKKLNWQKAAGFGTCSCPKTFGVTWKLI